MRSGWLLLALSLLVGASRAHAEGGTAVAEASTASPTTSPPALAAEEESPLAPASSDYETALAHALEAYAKGDFAAARIFLERAHSLEPSARTLRGLGIVAFSQARLFEAIRYLDAALASDVKPLPPELRASVEELLAHAWGQVGRFEIAIEPPAGDFLVDGRSPEFYAPNTVVLLPGTHVIKARAKGYGEYPLQLNVKPGENRALQIVLARALPVAVDRIRVEAAAETVQHETTFWTRRTRRITWASGGVLLAAGVGFYALAYSRLEEVVERCRDMADGTCTPRRARELYEQKDIKPLGITAFSLLGAGALVCLTAASIEIGVKLKADRKRGTRAQLGVGPSQLFVHGRF